MNQTFGRRTGGVLTVAAAVVVAAAAWILAVQPSAVLMRVEHGGLQAVIAVVGVVIGQAAQQLAAWLLPWMSSLLAVVGYALLALLTTVVGIVHPLRRPYRYGIAAAVVVAAVDVILRLLFGYAEGAWTWGAAAVVGIAAAVAVVWLWQWAWRRFPRLLNRETVSYVVFGVLTTVVNMVAFDRFFHGMQLATLLSNALAWVVAVLFAYVVNKWFVFRSRGLTARQWLREFVAFIGARVLSLGADELIMFLMVDCLTLDPNLSKLAANVVVMISNYFFSKWFIFKKEAPADA